LKSIDYNVAMTFILNNNNNNNNNGNNAHLKQQISQLEFLVMLHYN